MTEHTKKKVVFVLPALTAGGAERVLITLMNGIDRNRFDPVFLTVSAQGSLRALIDPAIPFHALGNTGRVGRSLPKLLFKLRRLKPDVIVSTMAHMNFGVLLLKPFFPHARFIVREAITPSFILQDRGMAAPLIRFLYKWLYPKADLVISPARIITDEFHTLLGVDISNHAVLPNPVDLERIRRDEKIDLPERKSGSAHFVCAGRLHAQKGFDCLIENIPADMDFRLTILGEGPERLNLEKLIQQKDMGHKISLPGLSGDPWPHYAAADAFLLPSRWEGLPNVVLEALACGTPVIAMREAGGIAEITALCTPGAVTITDNMGDFIAAIKKTVRAAPGRFRPSLLPAAYRKDVVTERFNAML